MTQQPQPWTMGEFAILLSSPSLSDPEVAQDAARSSSAVEIVRNAVCLNHKGEPTHGMLSQMMVDYLLRRRGSLTCQRCGGAF